MEGKHNSKVQGQHTDEPQRRPPAFISWDHCWHCKMMFHWMGLSTDVVQPCLSYDLYFNCVIENTWLLLCLDFVRLTFATQLHNLSNFIVKSHVPRYTYLLSRFAVWQIHLPVTSVDSLVIRQSYEACLILHKGVRSWHSCSHSHSGSPEEWRGGKEHIFTTSIWLFCHATHR